MWLLIIITSNNSRMTRKNIIILIFVLLTPAVFATGKDSTRVRLNRYSLAIGVGWTHYINTLELGKDNATINSVGTSLKFFWEPEHRLSLGLETGFYRLYSVKNKSYSDVKGEATMSAIPFLLAIRMRIVDNFYLSAGGGLALMINNVSVSGNKVSSKILSMANYQLSGSYIYPLSKHWNVGGEVKALYFGKASDWMYTVQAVCAVKL